MTIGVHLSGSCLSCARLAIRRLASEYPADSPQSTARSVEARPRHCEACPCLSDRRYNLRRVERSRPNVDGFQIGEHFRVCPRKATSAYLLAVQRSAPTRNVTPDCFSGNLCKVLSQRKHRKGERAACSAFAVITMAREHCQRYIDYAVTYLAANAATLKRQRQGHRQFSGPTAEKLYRLKIVTEILFALPLWFVPRPHNIPLSSSSAFFISSSLTTIVGRGTRRNIADAQAIESAKMADVSGSVVVEWPPR